MDNRGFIKIGYVESQTADDRIRQQTQTAHVKAVKLWEFPARFLNSTKTFTDKDFHRYLKRRGFKAIRFESGRHSEWFKIDAETARLEFENFRKGAKESGKREEYELREEQENAVSITLKHFQNGGTKFLWNAKPRFGKTLSAYDLAIKLQAQKILVVTNRPAISDSWKRDYDKFIIGDYKYMEVNTSFKVKDLPIIAFASLQNLKGAKIFGGNFDKLKNFEKFQWDLLIIDESHEGVETVKTKNLLENISRRWTLYLSGTPFKALADNLFKDDEIFNWSYEDEQAAKMNWADESANPYADLPQMNLFSYRLSKMIVNEINQGVELATGHADYAFDLNEFFSAKKSKFVHEAEVKKFLDTLTTLEKFPFSTPELREKLKHTFWLFHRVESVKAMAKLLKAHDVFKDYEIVIAAGTETVDDFNNKKSLAKVQSAIEHHDKTITLSVGQLTTGVTVPEWTAVFMLSNLRSAAEYMQAAFRAQNPNTYSRDGKTYRKENCYVFDFAPERTLEIYDQFANNLNPSTSNRNKNIGKLLNFFPVLAEDDNGKMTELNAAQITLMPRRIKCREVVESGFASNFLFVNGFNVFGAISSPQVQEIIFKLTPDDSEELKKNIDKVKLNDNKVKLGKKIYEGDDSETKSKDDDAAKKLKKSVEEKIKACLRGFTKTLPIFLMAYGNANNDLTLKNFDEVVSDEIFIELTGITKDEFHLLRDGGDFIDESGAVTHFDGVFDEIVFNGSIREFLKLKKNLAHYLDENITKTIFDYILPQRTNQIFTPRNVVVEMVDALEKIHPRIFDDPNKKFVDLHMKSGLFLAEIAKRLFQSKTLRCAIPQNNKRIKHIFQNQIFGFAPTEITCRIVSEYLFGAEITQKIPRENIARVNSSKFVGNENLREVLKKFLTARKIIIVADTKKIKNRVQLFGEVFTPPDVVEKMLDVEEFAKHVENINTKILEPTFGEGVFLVEILKRRIKNITDEEQIFTALSNLYGIEIQHDNVIAARENLFDVIKDKVTDTSRAREIIDANLIEGDFLQYPAVKFKDWQTDKTISLGNIVFQRGFGEVDKTFVIIGNPPYQNYSDGTSNFSAPIYHKFLETAYSIADEVMMIHPARCLTNASSVPKNFTDFMLNDRHLKVLIYKADAKEFFKGVDIKGGVVVTYRNSNENIGPIGSLMPFRELKSILDKVLNFKDFQPLSNIIYSQKIHKLSKQFYEEYHKLKKILSSGRALKTNMFETLKDFCFDEKPIDENEYIQIYGRIGTKRTYKWFRKDYIEDNKVLNNYKVLVTKASGTGAMGEKLSSPFIGFPLVGSTETFISIGAFETLDEAEASLKYIKTKFARLMLGTIKITQDATPEKWAKVPLQNFRADSDIDWTKSVEEIDAQLYKKYGLTEGEINFIEKHVRAMD